MQQDASRNRSPLNAAAIFWLVILCASWGMQQVAVKLALPSIPPLTQMALRSAGASLIALTSLLLVRRQDLFARDGSLAWGLLVGALFSVEFILIYEGLRWTDAGRAAVFIYTAPFFVAVGVHWFLPNERLRPLQWVGLLGVFIGVCVALGTPHVSLSTQAMVGDLMLLGAGVFWGATTLVIKSSPLRLIRPDKVLLYQLGTAAVCAGAITVLSGEKIHSPSALAYYALAYQTVWVGGVTFLLWFWLLSRYPASILQAGTSMTPLFGLLSAALILGEPLTLPFGIAVVVVVLSLAIINLPRKANLRDQPTQSEF
jgi:drug/metabolite transporter (DMT)-like permease